MTETTSSSLPWWRSDVYADATPIPEELHQYAGPHGIALVRAWDNGKTDPGWGLHGKDGRPGFIELYKKSGFNERRVLYGYERDRWNFAFVMRALNLVCVDIDGKNGGLDHVKKLGMLPVTLAETSKSGDGYHLFYAADSTWDNEKGFGDLGDRIGLEQGVDIRAIGCVYHHPNQRWNKQPIAPLPAHLADQLKHREQKLAATQERILKVLSDQDELEIMMMKHEILAELAKPIPHGKRNITLFAIGNQMRQAQVDDWEQHLSDKATEVGLGADETAKLISNIQTYGSPVAP